MTIIDNSQRIPHRISYEFPRNFQRNPKGIPKKSQRIPQTFPRFSKYSNAYIASRGRKPFRVCFLLSLPVEKEIITKPVDLEFEIGDPITSQFRCIPSVSYTV